MVVDFELNGFMPLLMHSDDIEASDALLRWRKAPENKNVSTPGDDRTPAWSWQSYLYSDGENIAMPVHNIMVCLRQAGTQLILKKNKTYKEITQSGLFISSEFCDFFAEGKQVSMGDIYKLKDMTFEDQANAVRDYGFRLYLKRARVGQAKHVRVRPRFENWSVKGQIQIMATKEITFDVLEQIFDIAGRVGLCDWRPGCKTPGPYGMFKAKLKAA